MAGSAKENTCFARFASEGKQITPKFHIVAQANAVYLLISQAAATAID